MKTVTIYGRFGKLLDPNDPNLYGYIIEGDTVTLGIAHRPDFDEDMWVIFENVLSFSDDNTEPIIPVEIILGFSEEVEDNNDDGISVYRLNTTERELTVITKASPTIVNLKSQLMSKDTK